MKGLLREQQGDALIQFLATLPLLALAMLIAVQVYLAGNTLLAAREAAHVAARAASVGGDAELAAQQAAKGYQVQLISNNKLSAGAFQMVEIKLQLQCPLVPVHGIKEQELWIPARAVMPLETS